MQKGNNDLGFILIETDKTAYYPGDQIKVTIYLQVNKDHVNGEKLFLKISGEEKVVQKKQGSMFSDEGRSNIYDQEVEVHNFTSTYLPLGKFEYKLEISIDQAIPGSIEVNDDQNNFSCQISYKLIAIIRTFDGSETPLKEEQILTIKEHLNMDNQKLTKTIIPEIQEWCFLRQGHPIVTASVDPTQLVVGKNCQISVLLNNANCRKDVRLIFVKLINMITLKFVNGLSKTITRIITKQQQPGSQAQTSDRQPKLFNVPLKDPTQTQLYGTVNGKIIKSSYLIEVSIEILINCSTILNPTIEIPIPIASEEPQRLFKKPPNWPKQVDYKIITIDLSQQQIIDLSQQQQQGNINPAEKEDSEITPKNDIMESPIKFESYIIKIIGEFNG